MTVNKAILVGRLGRDPELKYTSNQMAIATLSVATSERRKDGQSGQWVEQTEWHRVVVFGKTAEFCGQYLKKGRMVYCEGRIRTNKWQDKDGNDRYTTEVVANTLQALDKGNQSDYGQSSGQVAVGQDFGGGSGGVLDSLQSADTIPSGGNGGGSTSVDDVPFDDDDIPF